MAHNAWVQLLVGLDLVAGCFLPMNLEALEQKKFPASTQRVFDTGIQAPASTKTSANYPFTRYFPLTPQELEERREVFLNQNGGAHWSVDLDEFGLVKQVETSDPSLVQQNESMQFRFDDAERSYWGQFITRNADFFGIDEPAIFRLEYETPYATYGMAQSPGQNHLKAMQRINGTAFGGEGRTLLSTYEQPIVLLKSTRTTPKFEIALIIVGHFWPGAVLPTSPVVTKESIEKQFVGNEYTYSEMIFGQPCDPVPGGPPCKSRPPSTVSHTLKIQQNNLQFSLVPYLFRKERSGVMELRLVYIVELRWRPDFKPGSAISSQGWTKAFDAITGEELKPAQPLPHLR